MSISIPNITIGRCEFYNSCNNLTDNITASTIDTSLELEIHPELKYWYRTPTKIFLDIEWMYAQNTSGSDNHFDDLIVKIKNPITDDTYHIIYDAVSTAIILPALTTISPFRIYGNIDLNLLATEIPPESGNYIKMINWFNDNSFTIQVTTQSHANNIKLIYPTVILRVMDYYQGTIPP